VRLGKGPIIPEGELEEEKYRVVVEGTDREFVRFASSSSRRRSTPHAHETLVTTARDLREPPRDTS
jgi:hypothetical protein